MKSPEGRRIPDTLFFKIFHSFLCLWKSATARRFWRKPKQIRKHNIVDQEMLILTLNGLLICLNFHYNWQQLVRRGWIQLIFINSHKPLVIRYYVSEFNFLSCKKFSNKYGLIFFSNDMCFVIETSSFIILAFLIIMGAIQKLCNGRRGKGIDDFVTHCYVFFEGEGGVFYEIVT